MAVTIKRPAPVAVKSARVLKRKRKPKTMDTRSVFASVEPIWTYLHLILITSQANTTIDALTLRSCLLQAFSSYLGDHGAAIPVDILHISDDIPTAGTRRPSAYIRVPIEDAEAAIAGATSFTGSGSVLAIRVKSHNSWLAPLAAEKDGQDLFEMTVPTPEKT